MDQLSSEQVLTLALGGLRERAIEYQEKHGQSQMVHGSELPANMHRKRHIFEAMGIQFGEPVPGDPMFLQATLPPGWTKQAMDHPTGSHLLDDQGRRRASIFYKAAFYDRSASMSPLPRYSAKANYGDRDYRERAQGRVFDGDRVIWETRRVVITEENDRGVFDRESGEYAVLPIRDALEQEAIAWLNRHAPAWQDPLAYWDRPSLPEAP